MAGLNEREGSGLLALGGAVKFTALFWSSVSSVGKCCLSLPTSLQGCWEADYRGSPELCWAGQKGSGLAGLFLCSGVCVWGYA